MRAFVRDSSVKQLDADGDEVMAGSERSPLDENVKARLGSGILRKGKPVVRPNLHDVSLMHRPHRDPDMHPLRADRRSYRASQPLLSLCSVGRR